MNEFNLINDIILAAEVNGADAGGTYRSNEDGLRAAMSAFLKHNVVDHVVDIKEVERKYKGGIWEVLQFVPRVKND